MSLAKSFFIGFKNLDRFETRIKFDTRERIFLCMYDISRHFADLGF